MCNIYFSSYRNIRYGLQPVQKSSWTWHADLKDKVIADLYMNQKLVPFLNTSHSASSQLSLFAHLPSTTSRYKPVFPTTERSKHICSLLYSAVLNKHNPWPSSSLSVFISSFRKNNVCLLYRPACLPNFPLSGHTAIHA